MSKATYWQKGEQLDYKNSTTSAIATNTVVKLGTRIGIVGNTINPGETGVLVMEGVFEVNKISTNEITAGTDVYYDATNDGFTETATSNTLAGYAVQTVAAADTKMLVKLKG
ncbi:DUF2190 family protein [Anaerosporobacter faecicola]|uniref:DUF2190 family protein n=1 Tax=Anaerosporobacter faecicola TaxID=2718714 RepID=UPI00143C455C|nr:DUF2190 family protein [Anaerosporobacter faecicola]